MSGQNYQLISYPGNTPFEVYIIRTLSDNYSYLVIEKETRLGMAIDVGEVAPVLAVISNRMLNIIAIATTHHHADHSGGNVELSELFPKAKFFGLDERIPALTDKLSDGDTFRVGSLCVKCIHTPCHTSGSVSYVILDGGDVTRPKAMFTGDTLFLGGCGKFFEGSAEQMFAALHQKICAFPDETHLYVGHEYTASNLEFALSLEPNNPRVKARYQDLTKLNKGEVVSVPGSIGEERETNPFMRTMSPEIKRITGSDDPVEALRILRKMKNEFRK